MDKAPPKNWFDLPLEMREMVIDRMDPKTRCKFAQCSKLCEKEAKESNNYLYKLEISKNRVGRRCLRLVICYNIAPKPYGHDFWFNFIDGGNNQTIVEYKCGLINVKWSKVEYGKPANVRWKYFNEYLEKYKHCIRKFVLDDNTISVTDFNIKHLKNLKQLVIMNVRNGRMSFENILECGFIELKQLMWLEEIQIYQSKLTFEQVTKLEGKRIRVNSDEFNEENINKYLKMIKKGEILRNTQKVEISFGCGNAIFDVQSIMDGLDVFDYVRNQQNFGSEVELDYKFNFLSDVKNNGLFCVNFSPYFSISVEWNETVQK